MPGQKDSVEATWRDYWTETTSRVEPAVGILTAATGYMRHYLALADDLGVVTTVVADNGYVLDADSEIVIPTFDPEIWAAIGLYTLNATGASTWGTTDDNAQVTEKQLIGPVFPTGLGIDPN
jgi:hypothetical protein